MKACNPLGNGVHIMAETSSMFFEARWKPIEDKLVVVDFAVAKREQIRTPKSILQSNKRPFAEVVKPVSIKKKYINL